MTCIDNFIILLYIFSEEMAGNGTPPKNLLPKDFFKDGKPRPLLFGNSFLNEADEQCLSVTCKYFYIIITILRYKVHNEFNEKCLRFSSSF